MIISQKQWGRVWRLAQRLFGVVMLEGSTRVDEFGSDRYNHAWNDLNDELGQLCEWSELKAHNFIDLDGLIETELYAYTKDAWGMYTLTDYLTIRFIDGRLTEYYVPGSMSGWVKAPALSPPKRRKPIPKTPLTDRNNCTVDTLMHATGVTIQDAYDAMRMVGRKHGKGATIHQLLQAVQLLGFGHERLKLKGKTVRTIEANNPTGTYIISCIGHVLCLKDGIARDWSRGSLHRVRGVYQVKRASHSDNETSQME